jgi:hypothetical protein
MAGPGAGACAAFLLAFYAKSSQELSPLPSGEDDLWHEVGTYPYRIDTLVEEEDEDFEDEEEVDGHGMSLHSGPEPRNIHRVLYRREPHPSQPSISGVCSYQASYAAS